MWTRYILKENAKTLQKLDGGDGARITNKKLLENFHHIFFHEELKYSGIILVTPYNNFCDATKRLHHPFLVGLGYYYIALVVDEDPKEVSVIFRKKDAGK